MLVPKLWGRLSYAYRRVVGDGLDVSSSTRNSTMELFFNEQVYGTLYYTQKIQHYNTWKATSFNIDIKEKKNMIY